MIGAETTCAWYVDEDENGNIVRCSDDSGFCLVKDWYTKCYGKCKDYNMENKNGEQKA